MTEISGPLPGLVTGLRAVRGASDFLLGDYGGRSVAAQAQCVGTAEHIQHQCDALSEERPARLRVLVIGEFKAGKSSLINCLIGKTVTATDVGEMTTAVCRVVPADGGEEFVRLHAEDPGVPPLRCTIPEYLAESLTHGVRARTGQPSRLDDYPRADLHVRTPLPVELVDTPGLGASKRNEAMAMDALTLADLVLVTVDSDNLGGARDAALLDRIRETGHPLAVAITKTDLLEGDEQAEVVAFVARNYGLLHEALFPVSARRCLRNEGDAGVDRLRAFLTGAAPQRAALRERALLSQVRDLATEIAAGLDAVEKAADEALEDVQENRKVLTETAGVVTQDISLAVASMLRQKLRAEAEGILLGRIHNRATRITEEDFTAALAQSVRNMDARPFWERLQTDLEERFRQDWSEGIKRQLEILNANLDHSRQEMRAETKVLADRLAREEVGRLQRKEHAVGTAVAAGAAAVAMLVAGFPILLVAVTAAPGAWAYYAHRRSAEQEPSLGEIEYWVRVAVAEWVDEYVGEVMPRFAERLLRENQAVAETAADGYGRQRANFAGTAGEIGNLITEIRRHRSAMSDLTAQSRLLTTD